MRSRKGRHRTESFKTFVGPISRNSARYDRLPNFRGTKNLLTIVVEITFDAIANVMSVLNYSCLGQVSRACMEPRDEI